MTNFNSSRSGSRFIFLNERSKLYLEKLKLSSDINSAIKSVIPEEQKVREKKMYGQRGNQDELH